MSVSLLQPFHAHSFHGCSYKASCARPADRVKPSFVIFDIRALLASLYNIHPIVIILLPVDISCLLKLDLLIGRLNAVMSFPSYIYFIIMMLCTFRCHCFSHCELDAFCHHFYRAMHFSAKRGIAIACRLSVCPSVCLFVTLVNCDHIGWNSSKIISPLVSLGRSLFATPTWRVCSKGNTPKFETKVTHPLLI